MASDVGIVNSALVKIGADTITSLTDDSEEARAANAQYAKLRDEVLRGHPWNFAVERVQLAQFGTDPAFGYAKQYQLPADCLRVLGMSDDTIQFEIEGRKLLTDEETAKIRYIKQVTDPNEFDSFFRETLALRLAADLAYTLVNSGTLSELMMKLYLDHLSKARSIDAQEGNAQTIIEASTWVDKRA